MELIGGLGVSVVNDATVLEAVTANSDLIAEERAVGEADYSMSSKVVGVLGPAKVFRVMGPDVDVTLGGVMRMLEQLAFADPSVAWAATNSMGISSMCRSLEDPVAADVLDDQNHFYGVGLPPTGRIDQTDGGLVVSGRWPVVSGSEHASYFGLNCILQGPDGPLMNGPVPEMRFALVPRAAVEIERTWEGVMAVKGSGSHAVSVEGHPIDEGALVSIGAPGRTPSPWDQLPPFAGQSLALAAVGIGIARAAVEATIRQAGSRVSVANGSAWVDYPSVQNSVAAADITVEASRTYLSSLTDACWQELEAGGPSPRTQARLHAIADHALRSGRQAVSDLFAAGSVDAVRSGHVLEQCLRDIHGFSVQWERYRSLHYDAGRVMMGASPSHPLF